MLVAAAILAAVEFLMGALLARATRHLLRERKATGSSKPVTMASSPILIAYFIYHLPMAATVVASDRFGERTKALAVYVGTPLLYLAVFALTGRRGLGWHRW
jgi:hypothetical protein